MRWVAVLAVLVVGVIGAPPAGTGSCAGQDVPPPPPAAEELVVATPPLPVPVEPVGGPALAGCAEVIAPGAPAPPVVGAAAWVLADLDTGEVIAARAPHARHRPASALKVLTALVALRVLDPDLVVDGAATDLAIEGSRAGIGPGGRYTMRELLAGLLLNSGNDTAAALARALGGEEAALAAMTATARELGALDTRPATPSGLDGPGMASSAYDLALLFRVAMREPLFASTIATHSVPFPGYGDMPGFTLSNSSRFLARYPGALGGKAGFTDAARHTFVGAAQRAGRRLVVALMRGEQGPQQMWEQAAALLDHGFAVAPHAGIGTLVDAATPVPTTSAAPATGRPAPLPPGRSPPGPSPLLTLGAAGLGLVVIGIGAGAVLTRRTRR